MVIKLHLGADKYLRHNQIITIPEDKVEIQLARTALSFGELLLSVRNGEGEKQYKPSDTSVDITDMCQIPGRVDACVSLLVKGEVARTWQVEPFCIKRIPGGYEAIPEIEELKEKIRTLEKAVVETASIIEN